VPAALLDKHKVLQILVHLLRNAEQACASAQVPDKKVVVRIQPRGAGQVAIEVRDNGVGIASENLTRIFSHGFSTRKGGHGFGLHSAALAAQEMNGSLTAFSEGLGKGAAFSLELPVQLFRSGHAETE
jgi:signal transduction histidine kinase